MEAIEEQIPAAEMERMMKAQEVILKAAAGKLSWVAAAEIMGVTDRAMRRWRERLNRDYGKRKPSPKRVPMATVEQVLPLYREQYFDRVGERMYRIASGYATCILSACCGPRFGQVTNTPRWRSKRIGTHRIRAGSRLGRLQRRSARPVPLAKVRTSSLVSKQRQESGWYIDV